MLPEGDSDAFGVGLKVNGIPALVAETLLLARHVPLAVAFSVIVLPLVNDVVV